MMADVAWDHFEFCIRIAGNTGPRSLFAIWEKGFAVRHYVVQRGADDYQHEYEAKKNGNLFSATSPEELLGLIALWETRGESWRDATSEEWAKYDQLEDSARTYDLDGNIVGEE